MKTIKKIIDRHNGIQYIRIDNPPYMPLVIQPCPPGPRGLPTISVSHTFVQEGDIMRDPEIVFEIDGDGQFHPVSFRQDPGIYQEAVFLNKSDVMIRPKLLKELKSFARQWDRNLRQQGYGAKQ